MYLVVKWLEASSSLARGVGRGGAAAVAAEEVVMGGVEQWERVDALLMVMLEQRGLLGAEDEGTILRVREGVARLIG